jgi:hypothetical protein
VIFTEAVAHDAGGLSVGLVGRHAQFHHRVEDAAVDGLQAVAHVRQRAADDDRHRVADEGFFQLFLDVDGREGADVEFVGHESCSLPLNVTGNAGNAGAPPQAPRQEE